MAATLFTVADAKAQIQRPDVPDDDAFLLRIMGVAETAILRYVTNDNTYWVDVAATWVDPATVPPDVQHAMLLLVAQLWRYRGDEEGGVVNMAPLDDHSDMTPTIVRVLRRWRDPVLV